MVLAGHPDLCHEGQDNHKTTVAAQGDNDQAPRESITPPTSSFAPPQDPGMGFAPPGEDTVDFPWGLQAQITLRRRERRPDWAMHGVQRASLDRSALPMPRLVDGVVQSDDIITVSIAD